MHEPTLELFRGNTIPLTDVNLNITLEQPEKKLALFGSADRYLRMIRDTFGVQVVSRDDELRLSGDRDQVSKAAAVLEQMQKKLRRQDWLSVEDVGQAIGRAAEERPQPLGRRDRRLRQGPRDQAQDRGPEAATSKRSSSTT